MPLSQIAKDRNNENFVKLDMFVKDFLLIKLKKLQAMAENDNTDPLIAAHMESFLDANLNLLLNCKSENRLSHQVKCAELVDQYLKVAEETSRPSKDIPVILEEAFKLKVLANELAVTFDPNYKWRVAAGVAVAVVASAVVLASIAAIVCLPYLAVAAFGITGLSSIWSANVMGAFIVGGSALFSTMPGLLGVLVGASIGTSSATLFQRGGLGIDTRNSAKTLANSQLTLFGYKLDVKDSEELFERDLKEISRANPLR